MLKKFFISLSLGQMTSGDGGGGLGGNLLAITLGAGLRMSFEVQGEPFNWCVAAFLLTEVVARVVSALITVDCCSLCAISQRSAVISRHRHCACLTEALITRKPHVNASAFTRALYTVALRVCHWNLHK